MRMRKGRGEAKGNGMRKEVAAAKPVPDERLTDAIYKGRLSEVRTILESGVEVNSQRKIDKLTPLLIAVSEGRTAIVETLLEHGAEDAQNLFKMSAVKMAASRLHLDILEMLVEAGFDVDIPDYESRTALMALCKFRDAEDAVRLLLARGADVNKVDKEGNTPLSTAVGWENVGIIRILVENGATPEVKELGEGVSLEVRLDGSRRSR
jgi:ankyrin repeat protein